MGLLYVGAGGNDDQITHVPTSPPNSECSSTGWSVTSGGCEIDDDCCLTSPDFATGSYGNGEECRIQVGSSPGHISQEHFSTETDYDFLRVPTVDGQSEAYHGHNGPHDIQPQPQGVITWSSDVSITSSGFKLCLEARNSCPENGWMPPAVCPESWHYKGELVHGCTTMEQRSHFTCTGSTSGLIASNAIRLTSCDC